MGKFILFLMMMLILSLLPATVLAEINDCTLLKERFHENVTQEGQVCKVMVSRKKLPLVLNGVKVSPELVDFELAANFEKVGNQTVVLGEFALLSEEINPVIDVLRKGGLEVSALHNHWIGEQPRIFYLHFIGRGDVQSFAQTVKAAIEAAGEK